METQKASLNVDLNLIRVLRQFKHVDNEFEPEYQRQVLRVLEHHNAAPEHQRLQQLCAQEQVSLSQAILYFHISLAVLSNFEDLPAALGCPAAAIPSLGLCQANSTNIFNIAAFLEPESPAAASPPAGQAATYAPDNLKGFAAVFAPGEEAAEKEFSLPIVKFG